jgi:hypothetical protein
VQRCGQLQHRSDGADGVSQDDDAAANAPTNAFVAAQHGVNDGCREQAESAEPDARDDRKRPRDPELRKHVAGNEQRFQSRPRTDVNTRSGSKAAASPGRRRARMTIASSIA